MSGLLGALITGTDGMTVTSTALGVIGTNIANSNTVGYKANVERFETIVTQAQQVNGGASIAQPAPTSGYQWGSVKGYTQQLISHQGLIQASTDASNLAITGRGFFAVSSAADGTTGTVPSTAELGATRKGDFEVDKNGFLVNTAGYYLLGAELPNTTVVPAGSTTVPTTTGTGITSASTLSSLVPIRLQTGDTVLPQATTQVDISANLPAAQTVAQGPVDITASVFDAQGNSYDVTLAFAKVAGTTNTWTVSMSGATGTQLVGGGTTTQTAAAFGAVSAGTGTATVTFDSSGNIVSPAGPFSLGTISSSLGSVSPTFNLAGNPATGIGKTTQLDSEAVTYGIGQNGTRGGNSLGFTIDSNGIVTEKFSNGQLVPRYQVALVNYTNPDGLDALTGNFYQQSDSSGAATIFTPQTQPGLASIESSANEASNVELTDEFANMIITQRDFSANSKVLTTVDDMYSTITHLTF